MNVDCDTLRCLVASDDTINALMTIEGFRRMNGYIETAVNKSEPVKKERLLFAEHGIGGCAALIVGRPSVLAREELTMKQIIALMTAMALLAAMLLCGCSGEKAEATAAFNEAKAAVEQANAQADEAIASLQAVIDSDDEPLEAKTTKSAEAAISKMQEDKVEIPDVPDEIEDIKAKTSELKAVDYSADLKKIEKAKKALEESIAKYKLVTNPKESQVIKRLKKVKHVTAVKAVTEDNDPNGNLGKEGGYTSTVYFASDWVDQSSVSGTDVVDKGTDAGGSVEVYANVDDAQQRDTYLGAFDGSIMDSGSHSVYGTCVVRTSCKLAASQQKKLTKAIVKELTRLD